MVDGRFAGNLDNVKIASGLNIVAGVWLIIAPFLLDYAGVELAMWNSVIVGLAVVILAACRVANPNMYPGLSWANCVLGVWMILAPFLLQHSGIQTILFNNVMLGLIIAGLAAWSALSTPGTRRTTMT